MEPRFELASMPAQMGNGGREMGTALETHMGVTKIRNFGESWEEAKPGSWEWNTEPRPYWGELGSHHPQHPL